ncbi:MAG: ADP-forming succinate--CoA ligase subunit beta [Caldisericia bacterium]|nr:ADP-forming succinate--CoA ligase subunit beta [Caldisericia bacterium]
MKLLEYQAKEVFRSAGILTPKEIMVMSLDDAVKAAEDVVGYPCVVKAQVPVGGRGKAGGVRLAKSKEEVANITSKILGMDIKGCTVEKVLISEAVTVSKEYYLSVVLHRGSKKPMVIISPSGGVDIEEISKTHPEMIFKEEFDMILGFKDYSLRNLYKKVFSGQGEKVSFSVFKSFLEKLIDIYFKKDATLVEINPLIIHNGQCMALDAKILLDDNGLVFHPEFSKYVNDNSDETEQEKMAREASLTYISLEGDIACMVNGAGLAMATMDTITHFGGSAANFLDIGGSSNPEKVVNALKIIASNKKVKSILINIFGGITRCDDIANGFKEGIEKVKIDLPISCRIVGTNDQEAKRIMNSIGINVSVNMDEAIQNAVKLSKDGK